MSVTAVGEANAGVNGRAATFARITVIKLISSLHVDVFHQDRLIAPNIDFHMKLMQFSDSFVCKSAAHVGNPNYKLGI